MHGRDFDVDAAVRVSDLAFDRIWRRGEPKFPSSSWSRFETSGVRLELGDGRLLGIFEQQHLALEFLEAHAASLRRLGELQGADTYILGLQRVVALTPGLAGFTTSVPRALTRATLELGITPTTYVVLE